MGGAALKLQKKLNIERLNVQISISKGVLGKAREFVTNYLIFAGIDNLEEVSKETLEEYRMYVMRSCLSKNATLGTVMLEMTAVNRFSKYLSQKQPNVESLRDVTRIIFEQYLIHTNTEATGKKSYNKELTHLKSVLITAGKILEDKELEQLFYRDDIGKPLTRLYKVYSDAEIKRLNAAIVDGDEQVARVLFIHQMLGTRISETLTLRQDAIYKDENGKFFIRIYQQKTNRTIEKPINDDIKKLFDRACEYTNEKFGKCEYAFVYDKDSSRPMQYQKIKYHISSMVIKNDLRDDKGELFGVGTHIWRHCYGKRLTEMHVDDATIAKLLGHVNMSSLKFYRKIGNEKLADETREMRNYMDNLLKDITATWE